MLIFIDESGDLGFDFTTPGTSRYFVITAVVIDSHHDRRPLEKAVARTLKHKVNVTAKQPVRELKGSRTTKQARAYFWRHAQKIPFRLYTVAVDKEHISPAWQRKKLRLYNYLARLLVDTIPLDQPGTRLHIEIDRRPGRRQRHEFNTFLEQHLKARVPPKVPVFIYHMNSEQSKAIQATDVLSWGIARKYEQADREWYDIFRDRIVSERLYP